MPGYQPAKLLQLHLRESDRYGSRPLHEAIVAQCRELKIAGATVFRGLEGYGGTAEIHRAHVLRNELPLVVQIVDSAERIGRLMPVLEQMMDKGLMSLSDVQAKRIQSAAVDEET